MTSGHGKLIRTSQERSQTSIRQEFHGYALPVIAAGVIIAILYWARPIFITLFTSVIIALILEPFVAILMRLRLPRPVATLMVGLIAGAGLYFGGVAAAGQISGLAGDVPAFRENLTGFITRVTDRIENLENTATRLFVPARKAEPTPPPQPAPRSRRRKKEQEEECINAI